MLRGQPRAQKFVDDFSSCENFGQRAVLPAALGTGNAKISTTNDNDTQQQDEMSKREKNF